MNFFLYSCEAIVKIEIPPDDLPCTSAEAKKRLQQNKKVQESRKTLKCSDCQQNFESRDQLKEHREKEHSLSQCIICGENFVTSQELGRHSRKCKPRITKSQETTNKVGQTKDTIQEAGIADQAEPLRQCDLCDFKYV